MSETANTPEEPRKRGAHIQRGTGVRDAYGLTPGRRRFVKALAGGASLTDAYLTAFHGKDRANAGSLGSRLVRKPQVRKALDAAIAAQLSPENVMANFYRRANYDPADMFDEHGAIKAMSEMPVELRKACKKIEREEKYEGSGENRVMVGWTVKIELFDSMPANEHLAKLLTLPGFKQVSGATTNVQVNVGSGPMQLDPASMSEQRLDEWERGHMNEVARKAGAVIPAALFPPARTLSASEAARYEAMRTEIASWDAPRLDVSEAVEVVATPVE